MWIPPEAIAELAAAFVQGLLLIGRIASHLYPTWPGRF